MTPRIALIQHQHHRWDEVGIRVESVVNRNISDFSPNADGIVVVTLFEYGRDLIAVGQGINTTFDLDSGERVFIQPEGTEHVYSDRGRN